MQIQINDRISAQTQRVIKPIINKFGATSLDDFIEKFLNKQLSEEQYNELLKQVVIRFDTDPKLYEKSDFKKLIKLLVQTRNFAKVQLAQDIENAEDGENMAPSVNAVTNYVDKELTWIIK